LFVKTALSMQMPAGKHAMLPNQYDVVARWSHQTD
jgi:hypothetical protein